MPHLRTFHAGDESALSDICVRTADAGADARGMLRDDEIWGAVFAVPYAVHDPSLALVVADEDDRPVGYLVATADTETFEDWFASNWWPAFATRWPIEPHAADADVLRYAGGRRAGQSPYAAEYPAHLHIDLLPSLQGQGWGRRLIDDAAGRLRARGVEGVHLVAAARNTGAVAFYPRVGFHALPADEGDAAFGLRL